MNIFFLDKDPEKAAQLMVNSHIVKMPLETAQLFNINIQNLFKRILPFDKWQTKTKMFFNHPCAVWARKSFQNWRWLYDHGIALCKEYTFRYNKIHACQRIIEYCRKFNGLLPNIGLTFPALAMPDICKTKNAVISYRLYYKYYKRHLALWKIRKKPNWF